LKTPAILTLTALTGILFFGCMTAPEEQPAIVNNITVTINKDSTMVVVNGDTTFVGNDTTHVLAKKIDTVLYTSAFHDTLRCVMGQDTLIRLSIREVDTLGVPLTPIKLHQSIAFRTDSAGIASPAQVSAPTDSNVVWRVSCVAPGNIPLAAVWTNGTRVISKKIRTIVRIE